MVSETDQYSSGNVRAFQRLKRSRFRHMSKLDEAVWLRYLAKSGDQAVVWEYDVQLGLGSLHCPERPEELQPAWLELARKRVDAVGHFADHIEIIEVKPMASMSALGQVLSYTELYRVEKNPTKPLLSRVVCGCKDADLLPIFGKFGVSVLVV